MSMSFQDLERGGGSTKEASSAFLGGGGGGVSAGIFQLQTAVTGFRRLVDCLGTSKDTPALRNALQDARKRIGQLTTDTSDKFKSFSDGAAANRDGVANAERSRAEEGRLARDFQAVLQDFQAAQRIAAERESTFAPSSSTSSLGMEANGADDNVQAPLWLRKRQEIISLENEIAFNEAMIEERDQGIRQINYDVEQVNEIYRDLAVLLHGQRSTIDDIDKQVETISTSTAVAKSQIRRSSKSSKSCYQWCLWVLIFFVMALVILLVFLIIH